VISAVTTTETINVTTKVIATVAPVGSSSSDPSSTAANTVISIFVCTVYVAYNVYIRTYIHL